MMMKCASGVILIEVVVAALLCAICTTGIIAIPVFSERMEQRGDLTSIAYQFASECLDYLKNKAYGDYNDSEFLNPAAYPLTKLLPDCQMPQEFNNFNGAGNYTVEFYPSGTEPNETGKRIEVTITWTEPESVEKSVILTTLIAKLQ
jgi:hypothetical protein